MSLDNELDNALHQLVLCAAAPLQNPAQLHSTIDQIAAVALDRGVSLVFLSAVIAILTDSHSFDPASVARILALLLPRSAVAPRVLVEICAALGKGPRRAPFATQPALLKYAVMVYPLIEDHAQADLCYNILFHFLDYVTLRTHICHLLHLMTRRHHVKLHRIRKLQELQEFAVLDRPLNALFALYKEYYPDLILLRISRSKSTIFTHPDPEWLKRAQAIIQRESRTLSSDYTIQLNPTHPKEFKVPLATTFRATPQSITVKDIRSVADFVKYIDLVELPSQLVSILQNKLVQQIILHRESDKRDAMVRLKHWIQSFLYDEIVDKYEVEDFLIKLNNTCEIFGELLPGVQEWLYSFASSWTGEIFVEQIFGLVRFILPMDLHAFKKKVLEPFDTLFIKLAPHSQILCLKSFGRLVYQWSLRIQNGDQPLLSSFPPDTQLEKPSGIRDILSETVNHVDRWAVYALQKYPYNLVLHDAICKFYENLVVLYIEHPTLEICIPHYFIVYRLFFSENVFSLSRITGIISLYKTAFEKVDERARESRDFVNYFNSYVMDLCNLLWRNRAFNSQDSNARGCFISEEAKSVLQFASERTNDNLSSLFSVTHGSSTTLFASQLLESEIQNDMIFNLGPASIVSLRELAEAGGPSISYADFRIRLLVYLKEVGATGLCDFLYRSMQSLQKSQTTQLAMNNWY